MDSEALREAVESLQLIDAHAHNLVAVDSSFPFINCLTEAAGDSLSFAPHSVSVKRNLKDIAKLYGVESSLSAIEDYRKITGLESISSSCFGAAGISAILIDDGLELDKKLELEWHKSLVSMVGRILRIECLAENILDEGMSDRSVWTLDSFTKVFEERLKSVAGVIYGLKTIAAYRSGLDINTCVNHTDAEEGLLHSLKAGKPVRITNKNFIDYILTRSLEIALCFDLPIQIHTGFGDKDLDLRLANPLHLRALLEDKRFAKCRIVLLHASYPFSKEASYLASVYDQVYLDFGLAVPKLTMHGMVSSVKELLELAPIKKVMFSTDGYACPETFYLGAKKAREVVFSVLHDACNDGDLSVAEAIEAAQDIFAVNAIQFYKLHLDHKPVSSKSSQVVVTGNTTNGDTLLVRVIWIDASGQHRCRVIPRQRFDNVVIKNGVGLTFASMGMSSSCDGPADETDLTGVGEIRLVPDLSTRCQIPWSKQEEMVLADMHLRPGVAWENCPREALRRVLRFLKDEFNLVMNAGFENEFYILKNVLRDGKEEWLPSDLTPYCSTSSYDASSPMFLEILTALDSLNIPLEQLHAESGKGQFEVALGHKPAGTAADNVIIAREAIRAVVRRHELLATFVPKYALDDIGSGCHVHVSLWQDGKNVFMTSDGSSRYGMSKTGEDFLAGVLHHLPSILAITAPLPNSYDRIQPNTWSGAYQCWGKENREAPLRTSCPPGIQEGRVSNFELKSFDGCANPYLGLAAIAAAGIDGLRGGVPLPNPIDVNPYDLSEKLQRLPSSLNESLQALRADSVLKDLLGEKLWKAITGVRKAEIEYYSKNKDAYKQLIHRY